MKKIIEFFIIIILCLTFLSITSQNGHALIAPPLEQCKMTTDNCMADSEYKTTRCTDILKSCMDECGYDGIDLMSGVQVTEATCRSGEAQACYYCITGNLSAIYPTQYSEEAMTKLMKNFYESKEKSLIYSGIFLALAIITGSLLVYAKIKKTLKKYYSFLVISAILEISLSVLCFMYWLLEA